MPDPTPETKTDTKPAAPVPPTDAPPSPRDVKRDRLCELATKISKGHLDPEAGTSGRMDNTEHAEFFALFAELFAR